LSLFAVGEIVVDVQNRTLTAPVTGGSGVLMEVLRGLDTSSVSVLDVGLRRPTLDDVFLTLTGHTTVEVDGQPEKLKEIA
jgi:ABC-2 type transport system ATP-binding protein